MSNAPQIQYVFDAANHDPSGGKIPPVTAGLYDLTVVETSVEEIANDKGWTFVVKSRVDTECPQKGQIMRINYNLGHKTSPENCRISHNELSALCYVTGVFKINMADQGAALRGARYRADVTSDGNYNSIRSIFDLNGNRPNKAGTGYAPPQTAPVAVAQPAPAAGGWANPVQPQQPVAPQQQFAAPIPPAAAPQPVAQPGWNQAPQQQQPAPAAPGATPPWGAQPAAA